jgi:hypothetical protein
MAFSPAGRPDRIEEIVHPGSELNPDGDSLASSPALGDPRLRGR